MISRYFLSMIALGSSIGIGFGQESNMTDADKALVAYSHLGCFCDHGIALSPFDKLELPKNTELDRLCEKLPQKIREMLERDRAAIQIAIPDWPWLRATNNSSDLLKHEVFRFCRLGLIELFRPTYSNFLDSPLSEREDLMKRLRAIIDEARLAHSSFLNKDISLSESVIAVGTLRRLSVEFELEILNSLSLNERQQVAKFVELLMPLSLYLTALDQQKLTLGSANLHMFKLLKTE